MEQDSISFFYEKSESSVGHTVLSGAACFFTDDAAISQCVSASKIIRSCTQKPAYDLISMVPKVDLFHVFQPFKHVDNGILIIPALGRWMDGSLQFKTALLYVACSGQERVT